MLDLSKIARQIPGITQHMQKEVVISHQRLEKAQMLWQEALTRQEELIDLQEKWRDRFIFSAAIPVEPLDNIVNLQSAPISHSIFATDGSQISPSHHQIAYCYLINVGRVMLHYGQNLHPLLDSLPEVYYKPEDLYVSKKWGINTEEWMTYKRTVAEAQILSEMAVNWVKPPGAHYEPNLALVDGSLIYRFLEDLVPEARDRILPPILKAGEELRQNKIPLMGYVSASRSIETVNFLRLPACTYTTPNCTINCTNSEEQPPCQVIEPLRDTTFWQYLLKPGQRSPLWRSCFRILDLYDEPHKVYFCYVNVGSEIARIEMPAWVAEDATLLSESLSMMLTQVHKGYGYPVALAEAHNQAVVRGGDRHHFFALLEQQMVKAGLRNVGVSNKESRKRGSIA